MTTENAPRPIGPYSQAIKAAGMVFCAGQVGIDPHSGRLAEGGIEPETRQVLANLHAILAAAGTGPEHVVKTTIFLTDLGDFQRVNALYGAVFSKEPPARSTVQVARLPAGARVEIEAIALVP